MPKSIRAVCVLLLPLVLAERAFVQTAKTAEVLLVETGEGFHGDSYAAEPGESLARRFNAGNDDISIHQSRSDD